MQLLPTTTVEAEELRLPQCLHPSPLCLVLAPAREEQAQQEDWAEIDGAPGISLLQPRQQAEARQRSHHHQ